MGTPRPEPLPSAGANHALTPTRSHHHRASTTRTTTLRTSPTTTHIHSHAALRAEFVHGMRSRRAPLARWRGPSTLAPQQRNGAPYASPPSVLGSQRSDLLTPGTPLAARANDSDGLSHPLSSQPVADHRPDCSPGRLGVSPRHDGDDGGGQDSDGHYKANEEAQRLPRNDA